MEFDYSKYGVYTPPVHRLPTLSQDDLLWQAKTAYRRFYLRPSKITSPGFTYDEILGTLQIER